MGGTAGRIGLDIATGGFNEIGPGGQAWGGGGVRAMGSGGGSGGKGGKGGSAPSAPDFNEAARIQAESSLQNTREQTQANRPDQYGPFGYSDWTQNADGSWTQNTGLAGPLAAGAQNLQGQIANQGPLGTGDDARAKATGAYYQQAESRLDPSWNQREEATRAQLAAQGLDPSSEAYGKAMGDFSRARNDAYTSAEREAQSAGNQAQALTFSENQQAQMQPYQQLGMLQNLAQPANFMGAGQAQPLQSLAAAMQGYNGALQSYGIQQQNKNSKMNGAAGLGGAAILASDERLKDEIERLPLEVVPGVHLARWKWKRGGSRGFGVIAQDVEKVRPDLVTRNPEGVRMVDYGALMAGR